MVEKIQKLLGPKLPDEGMPNLWFQGFHNILN